VNSIPESASMRVDLRSSSASEIERLEFELRRALEQALQEEETRTAPSRNSNRRPELTSEMVVIGDRPGGELDAGARIEEKDTRGRTALMYAMGLACGDSNINVVRALLEAGASINAKDNQGQTALMLAVRNPRTGDEEVVKLLLASGADSKIKDNQGQTALMIAQKRSNDYIREIFVEMLKEAKRRH